MGINGPMGRTVADVALLLGTMSGSDPRLKELTQDNVLDKLKKDPKGVKIGWLGDWDGHLAMEKGNLETTEKALANLESAGIKVEKIKPFFDPEAQWEYEGAAKMTGNDVYNAYVKRTQFYNAMMKVYEDYDFLAVPSAQAFPFDKKPGCDFGFLAVFGILYRITFGPVKKMI